MKARKKHVGAKQKIREQKEREQRILLSVFLAIILIIAISVSSFLVNSILRQPSQVVNSTSEPNAAIVDQLSLTYPNQTFIQTVRNTLKQAGYKVDYYPGEQITVPFYKNLPTHGYNLIILRVHSALWGEPSSLALFTSEPYSTTKYVSEQINGQLGIAMYYPSRDLYFGISVKFLQSAMNGRFQNTTIIMMGCKGMQYTPTAEAFIARGAKVCIGWSDSVSAPHTDTATEHLLRHLVTEKQTIKQAVDNTMKEVGPDPADKSLLSYYPLEAGEQTIDNIADNLATKPQ
jgi:hypothetical protein